jgi:PAS domain S-box-containing protein/putative nucleotidyltransferase with HDIG domain
MNTDSGGTRDSDYGLLDNISSGVAVYEAVGDGEDFIFLDFNKAAEQIENIKKADLLGKSVLSVFPGVVNLGLFAVFQRVWRTGQPEDHEMSLYRDERLFSWRRNHVYKLPSGEIVAVYDDVSEQEHMVEALLEDKEQIDLLSDLLNHSSQPFAVGSPDGTLKICNKAALDLLGYTWKELQSIDWERDLTSVEWLEKETVQIHELQRTGQPVRYEKEYIRKDGSPVNVEMFVHIIKKADGTPKYYYAYVTDITERKKTEEQIVRSKALLLSVIDATPDFISVKDSHHRYMLVNAAFARSHNASPREMIGKADTDYFPIEQVMGNLDKGLKGFWKDDDTAFAGEIVHNTNNLHIWPDGSEHLYDTYKIPLRNQAGKVYGILVYSRDVTSEWRAEEDVRHSFEKLQEAFMGSVHVLAAVSEKRDPYTAGHQVRVSMLAEAIAREMGLPEHQVEGIKVGGLIHDIGKISIPSDILSKPGKLTEIEYSIVKTHPQSAMDILLGTNFPWPLAQMIVQHHERLDGSGYPFGLKGKDIMLEAKILSVADVVEAIASHRPYRPAQHIDEALAEISDKRGILYDEVAVDACLKLFRQKGFSFN